MRQCIKARTGPASSTETGELTESRSAARRFAIESESENRFSMSRFLVASLAGLALSFRSRARLIRWSFENCELRQMVEQLEAVGVAHAAGGEAE
jgi:hypothetical protein